MGGADRWLALVSRDEHAPDDRAAFGDVCTTMRLLHVDSDDGIISDQSFLNAILSSPKVAADERVESLRGDVGTGPMLSELYHEDVAKTEKATSFEVPATTMQG